MAERHIELSVFLRLYGAIKLRRYTEWMEIRGMDMDCKKCKQSGKVFDDDLDKARLTKINRRLVAAIVIIVLFAITAIVVNNIVWLNKWTQFDTISYSYDQDG